MPNHVTNRLKVVGEQKEVARMFAEIKGEGEDNFIDFNKIAPMPSELEGTLSPMRIVSQEEYDKQEAYLKKGELTEIEKLHGVSRNLTKELSEDYKKRFGADNWYDWNIANWGTKWSAYSQFHIEGENELDFDTAWSTPYQLLVKLSAKYPTLSFEVEYADEDFGHNVGKYFIQGGVCIEEINPEGGSIEAMRMAMEIKGDEDYYTVDYLCDEVTNELDKFTEKLVVLAHERGSFSEEYPKVVLEKLKELALADEQYERVKLIDSAMKETI